MVVRWAGKVMRATIKRGAGEKDRHIEWSSKVFGKEPTGFLQTVRKLKESAVKRKPDESNFKAAVRVLENKPPGTVIAIESPRGWLWIYRKERGNPWPVEIGIY